ncbi:MAG: type VI secretion system Vgr family protein [Planctomycetota bacterium]
MTELLKTQQHRPIALATPLGDDVLLIREANLHEELGRLGAAELDLVSEDHAVDAGALVGQSVTLRLALEGEGLRYFCGFVSRFTQLDAQGELAHYRATVVPWPWFLTRTADCRVFQNVTVPDLVMGIFREHGLTDFDDGLTETYPEREYCVQYRETDFAFVSRLLEEEGIYYFFRHEDGRHVLVLSDSRSSHDVFPTYETIQYQRWDARESRERITSWCATTDLPTAGVALSSFDYLSPNKELRVRTPVGLEPVAPESEIFDFDGGYIEFDAGERQARIRAEELQAQARIVRGRTNARGVAVGSLFELVDHPREDFAKEYLVLSTQYRLTSSAYESGREFELPVVECEFTALEAAIPYRSRCTTPRPVVQGPQTAIVVGKEGEEIWTDEHGRVKVLFHWDRYGKADETSSCWIRVAQLWAGKGWGSLFLPRVGHEVIVEFLEGNPDRPIVTGRVYNGGAKPAFALPDHAAYSGFRSNSTTGGGGFNELRFDDTKDEEKLFMHAQRNFDLRVGNDRFETVANNRHLVVESDKFEHVKNNRHDKVEQDHLELVGKDRHLKVVGKQAVEIGDGRSITVTGDVVDSFDGSHSEEVTGDYYLTGANIVIEGTDGITLVCGSNAVVIDSSGVTIKGGEIVLDGDTVKINSGSGSDAGSGSAGDVVTPAEPEEAEDADEADPGEVAERMAEQIERGVGKYGSSPAVPFRRGESEDGETTWIEIELLDEDDLPVAGEPYRLELSDGTVATGTLDAHGFARVEGIPTGDCRVTFPKLDEDAWEE